MDTTTDDKLGRTLVENGLAPNRLLLDINTSLSVPRDFDLPAPWNLPSRIFRFPIEAQDPLI